MFTRSSRRATIAATTALAAALAVAGCGGGGDDAAAADGTVSLTLVTTDLYGYTPLFEAKDLQVPGVKITYREFANSVELNSAMEAGQIDISDTGDIGPINAAASGSRQKVIGCTKPNDQNIKYIVRRDSGITSFADLRGKRVGMPIRSNHGLLYERLLKKNNLTDNDVKAVNISGADGVNALVKGDIEAYSANAPGSPDILERFPDLVEIDGIAGTVNNLYCLRVSPQAYEKKHEALRAFFRAAAELGLWASQHPDEAAELVKPHVDYSLATLSTTFKISGAGYQPIDDAFLVQQQAFADELLDVEFIEKPVDVKQIFVGDFNDELPKG
ncbi:ABC transporter substrate-binding protein [Polymorphospora sp. NPDC051019]|uniref:ABC transporter substrate-binding protein n=1 Tax=Polymorphospora sp. NPDC051019 TaxID=3155725 RepID=UPI003428D5DD